MSPQLGTGQGRRCSTRRIAVVVYTTVALAILAAAVPTAYVKVTRDRRDKLEGQYAIFQRQYDPVTLATVPAASLLAPAERTLLVDRWYTDQLNNAIVHKQADLVKHYTSLLSGEPMTSRTGYTIALTLLPRNHRALELLLANGWPPDGAAGTDANLTEAAGLGDPTAVDLLLRYGARPNLQLEGRGAWYSTPITGAASSGNPQIVKALLRYGADPRIKTDRGETALSIAISKRHYDIANLLRDYKPPRTQSTN